MTTKLVNGRPMLLCETTSLDKCVFCDRKLNGREAVCKRNFIKKRDLSKPKPPKHRWVSNRMLVMDTLHLIDKLPNDIDAIVGVPRSGMMPAAFIATTLHLPLYSITKDGEFNLCISQGRATELSPDINHALIIDDTVCRGGTMRAVDRSMVGKGINYTTACIYMSPLHEQHVGVFSKELTDPHILEWNLYNSVFAPMTAFDIDGILCPDVPVEDDDDGEKYIKCLSEMPLRNAIRRYKAGALITARLEKYRDITEKWLSDNGILYSQLIMGPWKNNEERAAQGVVAKYKVDFYNSSKELHLFIESNDDIASDMSKSTHKDIACPETERLY